MSAVHIRNVPEETVARLKERAAVNGRSLEAELRLVLDEAAAQPRGRRRRSLNLTTVSTGRTEPFNRADVYGEDDPDGR
ncbi:hypothetical protein GCM10027062_45610 [Nocardioides hungaricus]